MATVPGILLLGSDSIMGGPSVGNGSIALELDVDGTGDTPMVEFRDPVLASTVPSNAATSITTATTLGWFPWWDPWSDYIISAWATVSSTNNTVTLTTTNAGFTANELVGRKLRLLRAAIPSIGFADRRTITANTATTGGQTTITVNANWTSNPITTQLVCMGRGRWTDYNASGGWVNPNEALLGAFPTSYSVRGGSGETHGVAGVGCGPDSGLLWRLWQQVYTTAPYFQVLKWYADSTTKTAWESGGTAVTALAAEIARAETAWEEQSLDANTLSWEWIILDNSQKDVLSWVSTPANAGTYAVDLLSAISAIRTACGNASAKVLLINHDETINSVTNAGGTVVANRAHRLVAAADSNVFTVDLAGLGTQVYESQFWLESANRAYYARHEYWTGYPRRVVDRMKLINAGAAPGSDGGFPVYILIGDSIAAGPVTETFAISNDSPTLTEGARGDNQLIWNAQTGQGEQYNLADNSNTSGTTTGSTGGPEFALMPLLEDRHPEGFLLIKRASVGSCLIADYLTYSGSGAAGGRWSDGIASEHWDAFVTDFDNAVQWVNETKGKQADVRGAFVILGTNDQAEAGGGALFATELPQFVSDFRTRFATRTVANGTTTKALPIVWMRPQLTTSTAIEDESVSIRAAIVARHAADPQFRYIDVDALERNDTDNLHITQEEQIAIAERFAAAIDLIALA